MGDKSAVYYQRSKAVHEEFRLIEAATEREVVVGKLQKIIRSVKDKRLEMVDDVILQTFQLLNNLREVTIRLIKAIKAWQDSFTKPVRPTIYNGDYVIDRIIKHIDFVNGSKVRKIFNFQFFRGNPLLLPFPNLKTGDPIKVHAALAKEIRAFANPDEDQVVECYQFFINCVPPEIYNEKIISMQQWLIEPWVPRIFATNNTAIPCFPSSKQLVQATLQKDYRSNSNNTKLSTTADSMRPTSADARPRSNSATSQSSKVSKASSSSSQRDAKLLPPVVGTIRRRLGAQPLSETSAAGKNPDSSTFANAVTKQKDEGNSPPRVVRRNMMLQREQNQAIAAVTGESDLVSIGSQGSNSPIPEKEKPSNNNLSEAQQSQMQQLDLYYKELEGMFMPKFGRRAVQTLVAGGERTVDHNDPNEREYHYRTKRVFSMFTSKAFEKRIDDVEQGLRTEDFVRTDGQLIQKRNRILEQRGTMDREYKPIGGGARIQSSHSSKSLCSVPEQSTNSRNGSDTPDDEIDDAEDDGEHDEDRSESRHNGIESPGSLSRSPSNVVKLSKNRSSVSFSLQVESYDNMNLLKPPPIVTKETGNKDDRQRARSDSQSTTASPKAIKSPSRLDNSPLPDRKRVNSQDSSIKSGKRSPKLNDSATEAAEGKSPIRLSTSEMRSWYVEKMRREAEAQRQQTLNAKMG